MNQEIEMQDEISRQVLIGHLRDIESSEELFLLCVQRACMRLKRYAEGDRLWLARWIPILLAKP